MGVQTITDRPGFVEVRRETGFGHVTAVSGSERNAKIEIKAEHLQEDVRAWVDMLDAPAVHAAALASHRSGARVRYVIEVHRRGNAPDKPLAELANREKVRDLVECVLVDGDGAPLDPASAPAPTPPAPQTPAPQTPARQTPAGQSPPPLPPPDQTEQRAPEEPRRRGARVEEAKPWEAFNTDGSLNLGSYAVQASEGMVLLAHDLLLERWRRGDAEKAPTSGQVIALARRLLLAADMAQAAVRADGHADRMDTSHTRARAVVRAALDVEPVPFGAGDEELKAWVARLAGYATALLEAAVRLVDREVA